MNITLSADKDIIEKSRRYAEENNTTLNNLVRGFLKQISGSQDMRMKADEFVRLAKAYPGESGPDFRFDRSKLYSRQSR